MDKKKVITTLTMFTLMLVFATVAKAASSATVTATVTAQNISVSVDDGTVAYGTLALSAQQDTTASGLNDLQTATNDGNVTEDLNIRGADSAAWTLASSAGSEQYAHEFSLNAGSSWTPLTTSNQSLATSVATSGTEDFDLRLSTPTATSVYTQQSVPVTVQASAS